MSELIVTIEEGKLQGCILQNYQNEDIVAFKGIPFAEPPVGELRFKAPKPVKPWDGIKNATQYGEPNFAIIMSFEDLTKKPAPGGSEDSLTLNVFTKELPSESIKLKPVMVWVHGGGFVHGAARDVGPDYLLSEDIVLVTIQYRLGALGFLNFEDPDVGVPGNAGMKDMVLALKWVQRNIKQFNGDPDNVTIFGVSAGGAAVHYLMVSSMTKGLVHKVICQSGCASNPWARGSQNNGMELAKVLGCSSSDPIDCLKFLQGLPVDKVFQGQLALRDILEDSSTMRFFSPTIENKSDEEAFLLNDPEELLRSGNYNKVPLITGFTSEEGLLFKYMDLMPYGSDASLSPSDVCVPWYYRGLEKGTKEYQEVAQTILQFYFGNKEPKKDEIYFSMLSDIEFNLGIAKQTQLTASTSEEPVYFYRLSEGGDFDIMEIMSKALGFELEKTTSKGVSHGGDMPFLFKLFGDVEKGSLNDVMIKRFLKLWTNFARTGNPNSLDEDGVLQGVNWKPLKAGNYTYLDIGKELSCNEEHPNIERIKFWDNLDKKYRI